MEDIHVMNEEECDADLESQALEVVALAQINDHHVKNLETAIDYCKKARHLLRWDVHNPLSLRPMNIIEQAISLYSDALYILRTILEMESWRTTLESGSWARCRPRLAEFVPRLAELIMRFSVHIEEMKDLRPDSLHRRQEKLEFYHCPPEVELKSMIQEISTPKARDSSMHLEERGQNEIPIEGDIFSPREMKRNISDHVTVNKTYIRGAEISGIISNRTSLDSFATATSLQRSYTTAPSFIGSVRSNLSTIGVKHSFQALLQRGISPQILLATKVGHRLKTQMSRPSLIPSSKGIRGARKFSHLRDLPEELENVEHSDDIDIPNASTQAEGEHSFNELDWCGRGMHVDFKDNEEIPLKHIEVAGHSSLAVVDIVRCRRIKVARKIVRLPRKKITSDVLQEALSLHFLSHAHIVRLVGTYIHKRQFATLMYPAAEMNLEEYLEELQPDPSLGTLLLDEIFGYLAVDKNPLSVLREGSACLTSGLRYLHSKGVIHSDIKPANILIKDVGYMLKMYFCDFGISKMLDPQGETQTEEDRGKTPRYAPPEVMRGESHGRAADIYSFGYMLAEMTTVYSGLSIKDFRNYIQSTTAEPPLVDFTLKSTTDTAPFRAYHHHYKPYQIEKWFWRCSNMEVPNNIISQMINENPRLRPRLAYSSTITDALVRCRHDDEGAPPFEMDRRK